MINKYKHIIGFFLLSAVLATPYAIKLFARRLEPYPAIIMPAGAGTVTPHRLPDGDMGVLLRRPGDRGGGVVFRPPTDGCH